MNDTKRTKTVGLLKAGQFVEIDNHLFKAMKIEKEKSQNPCDYCNVDCCCQGDVLEVCKELDFLSRYDWFLVMVV